jgi:hypothetical protein
MRINTAILPLALAVAAAATAAAQQPLDTTYARLVREATTDARFLPASVATLPVSGTVPSPRAHFGTIIGAPGVMHRTADIYGYFRALAKASPRVHVESVGRSEEGREFLLAAVADEGTIRELDRYREALAALADPRATDAARREAVIAGAKPIYYLNAGLHSPEMGSPEMVMELAYRLATSDDPVIRKIRERVIVLINPASEPDGRDKQVDWYYRYTKGRPDYDDGFPRTTPYWGRYAEHDNNRDGIQVSQALSKVIAETFYRWHPIVMHDLHESVPLLYISTGTGPYNETNDPIMVSEWQLLANHDITALTAQGLPGVWTWGFFDGWWPGYGMWVANNHNAIGRFYETFGNAGADTYVRDLSTARFAGEPVTSRQWYRSWPPSRKVRWSARDNVNYMEAGVLASLEFTADNAPTMLRNFWQKGANSIERGRTRAPHAFVIPALAKQRDPVRAAYLVNQLRRHGIEVQRRAQGDSAGDFVVRLDQPYRDLAVNLLTTQKYPSTAQYPPYDDIAWTLGYMYGADVTPVNDTSVFHWAGLEGVRDSVAAPGVVRGTGTSWAIANTGQVTLLPALYAAAATGRGVRLAALRDPIVSAGDTLAAGSVIIDGLAESGARALATRFGLTLRGAPASSGTRAAITLPRVALYHAWHDTQDEGWARFTLERYGIPFTGIDKDDLRAGGLRRRFDVILMPQARGGLETLVHEEDRNFGPIPFRKSEATPALGTPFATDDITGGMGFEGLAGLQRFVEEGGTLITLGNSSRLPAESGLAGALSTVTTRTLFHPGSVVRARARRASSPILWGYPEVTHLFRGNGPLFSVADRDSAYVVLQYGTKLREAVPDTGDMLGMAPVAPPATRDSAKARKDPASGGEYVLSGMVRGQDEIVGQAAILDVPVGKGRVIAFTFDPLHRFLNHHDFPLVWNALMSWDFR